MTDVQLRDSSNVLHLQAGEFDPLSNDGPFLDSHFMNLNDPTQTGLAMIQLHHHDGTVLESLSKDYSITPLDYISDEGGLVRLPSPALPILATLQEDDRVRWAGIQHPGMESSHLAS